MTIEQIMISVDRLTRFKDPELKYLRVFKDILLSNLIYPKFKRVSLDNMNYSELKNYAEYILNYSLEQLGCFSADDFSINKAIFNYENAIFKLNNATKELLNNKINYSAILSFISDNSPSNLKWLKWITAENFRDIRIDKSAHFPLEKVVITEGITEEILLPVFAKVLGYDFDKFGVHIISAGGKNQVVKLFYQLVETLKLPIFVLLDNDAVENLNAISPKLRDVDSIHLLRSGEFEDLLPLHLIQKTLNYDFKNFMQIDISLLKQDLPMVKILEDLFKQKGLHEFKKAEFAELVAQQITSVDDISDEVKEIICELRKI